MLRAISRFPIVSKQIRSFTAVGPFLLDSVEGKQKEVKQKGNYLSWYSCGPTVYDSSHVGHARTYVQIDLLQRILQHQFGLNVYSSMGITNIDDKIINKSKETGIPWRDIAAKYEAEFFSDMRRLNVKRPLTLLRVSDMIPEIIDFIKQLEEKNIAYKTSSGVYFDTQSSLYTYSKLVPPRADDDVQSRLSQDPEKRHPRDFALWKPSADADYAWDSPWGKGRPGWHVECSVNCHSLFGDHLDIHAGGVDLKFPHHCNEIAQCEAFSGHSWCDIMLHIGHIFIEGRKMSKSLKNFITIDQLLQTYTADEFRMFCLLNHYSARVQLDDNGLAEAKMQWNTLLQSIQRIRGELAKPGDWGDSRGDLTCKWMSQWGESKRRLTVFFAENMNTREVVMESQRIVKALEKGVMENRSLMSKHVTSLALEFVIQLYEGLGFSCATEMEGKIDTSVMDSLCEFRTDVRNICLKEPKNEVSQQVLHVCDAVRNTISDRHHVTLIDGKSDVRWVVGEIPKKHNKLVMKDHALSSSGNPIKPSKPNLVPSIPPSEMFRSNPEYSQFDKDGIPTHDKEGKPLSASRLKKLRKQFATHRAIHTKWLAQQQQQQHFSVCLNKQSHVITSII